MEDTEALLDSLDEAHHKLQTKLMPSALQEEPAVSSQPAASLWSVLVDREKDCKASAAAEPSAAVQSEFTAADHSSNAGYFSHTVLLDGPEENTAKESSAKDLVEEAERKRSTARTLQMAASQQRRLAAILTGSEEGAKMLADAALQEEQAEQLIEVATKLEALTIGSSRELPTARVGGGDNLVAMPREDGKDRRDASVSGSSSDESCGQSASTAVSCPFVRAVLRRDGRGLFRILFKENSGGIYISKLPFSDAADERGLLHNFSTAACVLRGAQFMVRSIDGKFAIAIGLEQMIQHVREAGSSLTVEVFRIKQGAGNATLQKPDHLKDVGEAVTGALDGIGTALGGLVGGFLEHPQIREARDKVGRGAHNRLNRELMLPHSAYSSFLDGRWSKA
ncbi:MAG: hypothetical protein SGPRY_002832 [Prymnesium sp.]